MRALARQVKAYLHSTLVLLKVVIVDDIKEDDSEFTFYFSSIKG